MRLYEIHPEFTIQVNHYKFLWEYHVQKKVDVSLKWARNTRVPHIVNEINVDF